MRIILGPHESLVSERQAVMAYSRLMESIDTPVSLAVSLQLKHGCIEDLVNRKIDPKDYVDVESFRKDYQAVKGLSKATFLKTSIDRRKAAVDKFWGAEKACERTNRRFDDLMYNGGVEKLLSEDPGMFRMLSQARNQILKILGHVPKFADFRFGPGVTSLVKRHVTLPQKYSRVIHVTPELYSYWRDVVGPLWGAEIDDVKLVGGNAVSFVEKNAKTDRAIAIEPHVNVYAQLGIGQVLRDKLRRWVDLDHGQEVNRLFASNAQEWALATVDLESASDTISRSLVWFLLPEAWANLLDTCRSHRFTLDGEEYESQKFSSMGNGFTFELETIIFYALARAAGSHPNLTCCYGDDIIVEKTAYLELERLLQFAGFSINSDKTFTEGSFFESCGEDYFDGVNVRPFFWKDLKPTTLFKMINDVSRFSSRNGVRNSKYVGVYNFLVGLLPKGWADCRIPYGYGDIGIHTSWDDATPRVARNPEGWCGFTTKAVKFRPTYEKYSDDVRGYLASLDTMSETSRSPVRGRGKYVVGDLVTFGHWVGPGPWVSAFE